MYQYIPACLDAVADGLTLNAAATGSISVSATVLYCSCQWLCLCSATAGSVDLSYAPASMGQIIGQVGSFSSILYSLESFSIFLLLSLNWCTLSFVMRSRAWHVFITIAAHTNCLSWPRDFWVFSLWVCFSHFLLRKQKEQKNSWSCSTLFWCRMGKIWSLEIFQETRDVQPCYFRVVSMHINGTLYFLWYFITPG